MRYIDLLVQSVILILAIVLTSLGIGKDDFWIALLFFQFLIGAWQLLSSVVSVLKHRSGSPKKFHFTLSLIYLAILFVTTAILRMVAADNSLPEWLWRTYLIGPPWILAIYHYMLTWRMMFSRYKKSSNFLPHINF